MLQSKPSATTDQCMQFPDLKTFQINVGIVRAPLLTYKLLEPRLEGLKMDLERINATQYPTTTKKRQSLLERSTRMDRAKSAVGIRTMILFDQSTASNLAINLGRTNVDSS